MVAISALWRLSLILAFALLASCGAGTTRLAPRTMTLAPASASDRLAKLRTALLPQARADLLARVTDAQWAVEQIGDGMLGPADFVYRIRLRVPLADMPAWLSDSPVAQPDWPPPASPLPWWITPAQLGRARFAEGGLVAGQSVTFAALPSEGVVFVFRATQ